MAKKPVNVELGKMFDDLGYFILLTFMHSLLWGIVFSGFHGYVEGSIMYYAIIAGLVSATLWITRPK